MGEATLEEEVAAVAQEEVQVTRDTCQTCGERAWGQTPDGQGGTVYAYNCMSEVVVRNDGMIRVLKACPNWEKRAPGALRDDL